MTFFKVRMLIFSENPQNSFSLPLHKGLSGILCQEFLKNHLRNNDPGYKRQQVVANV